jgi:V8-like Glu-specific endopeptidase
VNRNLMLSLALLMLTLQVGHSQVPKIADKSHKIQYVGRTVRSGHCTATAIGPHALLTASHCEKPSNRLRVDGGRAVEIVQIKRDDLDHTILYLKDITFTEWANFSFDGAALGEEVFMFGNPGSFPSMLRRGYFSGVDNSDEPIILLLDMNGFFGDSGSGVFNKNGDLIGVISIITQDKVDDFTLTFMGIYPMGFKEQDFEEAKRF